MISFIIIGLLLISIGILIILLYFSRVKYNALEWRYNTTEYQLEYFKNGFFLYRDNYILYKYVFELSMLCCRDCLSKDDCPILGEIQKKLEVAEIARVYNLPSKEE